MGLVLKFLVTGTTSLEVRDGLIPVLVSTIVMLCQSARTLKPDRSVELFSLNPNWWLWKNLHLFRNLVNLF